jgi:hypothetical protein
VEEGTDETSVPCQSAFARRRPIDREQCTNKGIRWPIEGEAKNDTTALRTLWVAIERAFLAG